MKAITLWQPQASLAAVGEKPFETRRFRTRHRGEIAIHAGKRFTDVEIDIWRSEPFYGVLKAHNLSLMRGLDDIVTEFPAFGAIVAVATIAECIPTEELVLDWPEVLPKHARSFGDFGPGRYAWRLVDVHRLPEPIPCRGMPGIWPVPADVEAQLRAQIVGIGIGVSDGH